VGGNRALTAGQTQAAAHLHVQLRRASGQQWQWTRLCRTQARPETLWQVLLLLEVVAVVIVMVVVVVRMWLRGGRGRASGECGQRGGEQVDELRQSIETM
jgi:hypothetical protein